MPGTTYLKREGKAFVKAQSAWNTVAQPVAGDAFRFTSLSFKENPERDPRTDQIDTRSEGATIQGRTTVEWSAEGFFMPSGALGVAPDIGPFLKQIFGIETVNGGASVVYTFHKDPETVVFGLSIWHFGNHFGVGIKNAIVKELEIKGSGGDQSTFTMSGEATTLIRAGSGTLNGALSGGEATITVQTGEGAMYSVDAKIDVGSSTAHVITSVSGDDIGVSPVIVGAQSDNTAVIPTEPTPTYVGSPVSKVRGTFDLGAVTYKLLEGSVKISDPSTIRNDEFGTATASGFDSVGARAVTFTGQSRLLTEFFKEYGGFANNTQKALNFFIGDTATERGKFAMPAFEGMPGAIDSPDDAPAVLALDGPAKPTANENELVLTFD